MSECNGSDRTVRVRFSRRRPKRMGRRRVKFVLDSREMRRPFRGAEQRDRAYRFGIMMCAVNVPAPMIKAPPLLFLRPSGRPVDSVVAPGTAIMR